MDIGTFCLNLWNCFQSMSANTKIWDQKQPRCAVIGQWTSARTSNYLLSLAANHIGILHIHNVHLPGNDTLPCTGIIVRRTHAWPTRSRWKFAHMFAVSIFSHPLCRCRNSRAANQMYELYPSKAYCSLSGFFLPAIVFITVKAMPAFIRP